MKSLFKLFLIVVFSILINTSVNATHSNIGFIDDIAYELADGTKGTGTVEFVEHNGTKYVKLAEGVDDLLDAIRLGKRADGSLARALDNASFPKSGTAVRQANSVNRNNKRLLDIGDSGIPNAISDYSFTKGGQSFSKLGTETWDDYFKRLKNNGFNTFESHHIFPVDLFKRESFRKWYELEGFKHFDINGSSSLDNLIMLEKKIIGNGGVHSKHNAYTSRIGDYFDARWNEVASNNPAWSDLKIAQEVNSDMINLSNKLKESLLNNSVKSNVEISTYWDNIDFNSLFN